ncbi:hypothetical protein EBZ80_25085 [bacterium]|nr:hypothetical protein [bacterium]
MSFPSLSVFKTLVERFPSWTDLKTYLTGPECALSVVDASSPESPYAIIRAVKGLSVYSNTDVRAFRSVVWDTLTHRPVSVTPFKSADGESMPADGSVSDYRFEMFHDGTLIGMFWDSYSSRWRIHTRSVLDAGCRYFSASRTFASMFAEATRDLDHADLDKTKSYSWVLMHPENRIVCDAPVARAVITDICALATDGAIAWEVPVKHGVTPAFPVAPATWDDVRVRLAEWNTRFRHNCQGIVVKSVDGCRWKIRTEEYNRVRRIRGNSPRRDFLWLNHWVAGTLPAYLAVYPEERGQAQAVIDSWKTVTRDVYRIYCDVFKAHTLDKKMIPPKYRPTVYGLHKLYHEVLKPAGQKVDWKTALAYMNGRDVPLMLFTINWEARQAARALGVPAIPFEPPAARTTTVEATEDTVEAEATA